MIPVRVLVVTNSVVPDFYFYRIGLGPDLRTFFLAGPDSDPDRVPDLEFSAGPDFSTGPGRTSLFGAEIL